MANTPDRFGVSQYLLLGLLIIFAVGCSTPPLAPTRTGTPRPAITPTPTTPFNTSAAVQWGTLPPEWTATFTLTPSRTFTPSPVPPTATPVPPATIEEVCESISFRRDFADGATFTRDESIGFIIGTLLTEVLPPDSDTPVPFVVRFIVQHEEADENLGADVPAGEIVGLQLDVAQLAVNGAYRWTVSIVGEPFGEACTTAGTFVVVDELTPTPAAS